MRLVVEESPVTTYLRDRRKTLMTMKWTLSLSVGSARFAVGTFTSEAFPVGFLDGGCS